MGGMVRDAKLAPEDVPHPLPCPDVAAKAKGFSASLQQTRHLRSLCCRQAWWRTGSLAPTQGLHATHFGSLEPLADSALGDAQGMGDRRLRPALVVQFPSPQPATFAPVVGLSREGFSRIVFHGPDDTTSVTSH